jgi:hypothetical protein
MHKSLRFLRLSLLLLVTFVLTILGGGLVAQAPNPYIGPFGVETLEIRQVVDTRDGVDLDPADIVSDKNVRLVMLRGGTARNFIHSSLGVHDISQSVYLKDYGSFLVMALAMVPSVANEEDHLDAGAFRFVIVTGRTASKLAKKWGDNLSLDLKNHELIFLSFPTT